jgi:hypothetical protein
MRPEARERLISLIAEQCNKNIRTVLDDVFKNRHGDWTDNQTFEMTKQFSHKLRRMQAMSYDQIIEDRDEKARFEGMAKAILEQLKDKFVILTRFDFERLQGMAKQRECVGDNHTGPFLATPTGRTECAGCGVILPAKEENDEAIPSDQ